MSKSAEELRQYLENLSKLTVRQQGRNYVVHSMFSGLPKPLKGEFTSQHLAMQAIKDFQAGVRAKAQANSEKRQKEMQRVRAYRKRLGELSATSNATTAA